MNGPISTDELLAKVREIDALRRRVLVHPEDLDRICRALESARLSVDVSPNRYVPRSTVLVLQPLRAVDLPAFTRQVLDVELYDWQADLLELLFESRTDDGSVS